MKALLQLVLVTALSVSAGFAVGNDTSQAATSRLAQAGEVDCQPALPFFCGNIHVECSGRSTMSTFPFKLRATPNQGWIEPRSDTLGVEKLYENGRIEWGNEDAYVILRPHASQGYIKLLANGTYSFRYYSQDIGTMSHGRCR